MATTIPMSSTRQVFGNVDASRLRNLSNIKNRQNALQQLPKPGSLKRSCPPDEHSDSENVNPAVDKGLSKRIRTEDGLYKPSKPDPFSLKVVPFTKTSNASSKQHNPTNSINTNLPTSAPAAAGRSPKAKNRVGILSRRRSGTPVKRIDPPVFTKPAPRTSGFSIDAALGGTAPIGCKKTRSARHIRTIEESMPKGWMFDIHEDTEHDEFDNLLGHSTQTLDISDDESKIAAKNDRGKENIPPEMGLAPSVVDAPVARYSQKDVMSDDIRIPLGDLNPRDYYADGCDENSYYTYPVEVEKVTPFSFGEGQANELSLGALIQAGASGSASTPAVGSEQDKEEVGGMDGENAGSAIDIWESSSAKDEAEGGSPRDNIFAL